jgi:hypothetical protein
MYRYGDTFGGINGDRILQGSVLDDIGDLNATKPGLEMFIEAHVDWVHSLEPDGIAQFEGMPAPPKN